LGELTFYIAFKTDLLISYFVFIKLKKVTSKVQPGLERYEGE